MLLIRNKIRAHFLLSCIFLFNMEKLPVQDVLKGGKKTCEKDKVGAKILLDISRGHRSGRQLLCVRRGIYPVSHLGCERNLSLAQLGNVSLCILDLASEVLPFHGQLLLA